MSKILVIDDDKGICSYIKDILEDADGYKVSAAHTGKEGLKIAKEEDPDLILLDVLLPDINGLDLLKKLSKKKATCYTPVVMLTGVSSKDVKEAASREYVDGYIVKPFDPDFLQATVARTLKFHSARKLNL